MDWAIRDATIGVSSGKRIDKEASKCAYCQSDLRQSTTI
jgi:hypothetical protein